MVTRWQGKFFKKYVVSLHLNVSEVAQQQMSSVVVSFNMWQGNVWNNERDATVPDRAVANRESKVVDSLQQFMEICRLSVEEKHCVTIALIAMYISVRLIVSL